MSYKANIRINLYKPIAEEHFIGEFCETKKKIPFTNIYNGNRFKKTAGV